MNFLDIQQHSEAPSVVSIRCVSQGIHVVVCKAGEHFALVAVSEAHIYWRSRSGGYPDALRYSSLSWAGILRRGEVAGDIVGTTVFDVLRCVVHFLDSDSGHSAGMCHSGVLLGAAA